jgi:hypothetical protein
LNPVLHYPDPSVRERLQRLQAEAPPRSKENCSSTLLTFPTMNGDRPVKE